MYMHSEYNTIEARSKLSSGPLKLSYQNRVSTVHVIVR